MKKIILIVVSIILVFSCDSDNEQTNAVFDPVEITAYLIGKKYFSPSAGVSQQNSVINDEVAWTNLKNQIDSQYIEIGLGNYYTQNNFEETTIDFNNFIVIAVIDQFYTNGGYTIDITNITEFENEIVVTIENLNSTGNGSNVAIQPYHIVKIPKVNKPIFFNKI